MISVTKPGMKQKHAGEEDHCAIGKLASRVAPGIHLGAIRAQDAKPLNAKQDRAELTPAGLPGRGRQYADLASDHDEGCDLEEGQGRGKGVEKSHP